MVQILKQDNILNAHIKINVLPYGIRAKLVIISKDSNYIKRNQIIVGYI